MSATHSEMSQYIVSGRALHSGVPSTVRVVRREDDGIGIRFSFPGFHTALTTRDLIALDRTARRATILTQRGTGATIRTPEHLFAAALFFADEPLDIVCDAAEIPGVDGSARPWFELLATAAHPEADVSHPLKKTCREYDTDLTWSYTGREGTLHAEPASRFSVRSTVVRGDFRETFELQKSDDGPESILPARTFIFWGDWRSMQGDRQTRDVLAGAGPDSGLVLAESHEEFAAACEMLPESKGNVFPLVHPETYRLNAEAARHKVLDLLGDLALNGLALPKLRVTITNGGHALNHLLLDALLERGSGDGL